MVFVKGPKVYSKHFSFFISEPGSLCDNCSTLCCEQEDKLQTIHKYVGDVVLQ